jgi:hypothetical protein
MNKFRKLGFVAYNGGLEVHSSLLQVACTTERRRRRSRSVLSRREQFCSDFTPRRR